MPAVSLKRRAEQLARDMAPSANLIDLGIEVQGPDGRALYRAGGVWDKRLRKYARDSAAPHAIRLVGSQLRAGEEMCKWFLDYEADAPNRLALINCVDERRGGKTWFVLCAVLSFALKFPRSHLGKTVAWVVVPTYPQQREIHETLSLMLPAKWCRDGWIKYHKAENFYRFANGTEVWIKSADRPDGLKWGSVSLVAVNEAQQIDERAILNIIGSNVDNGGLTILAMNPPDSVKGLWAEELHDALEALDDKGKPVIDFACEVKFPASKNSTINQAGRARYLKLAQILNPKQAKRDGLGIWIRLRDRAYPMYNKNQHFRPEPTGWQDITAHVNGLTGYVDRGQKRPLGAGMDWQHRPYCAWIEAKVLLAPAGAWVPKGTPVFVISGEVMNDISSGQFWDEELLCIRVAQRLAKLGRTPQHYLLIGDATGHDQGASGGQRGRESDPDSWSWSLAQQAGWDPHAPIEMRKMVAESRGPSTIKTSYSNPRVPVRLDIVNQLLRANRIVITRECPETAESFWTCSLKGRKPWGRGAHLTDAAAYLLFTWERALREAGVVKAEELDVQAA